MLPCCTFIASGADASEAIIESVSLTANSKSASGLSTYTFSSFSLGTTTSNTHLLILISFQKAKSRELTGVTINGDPLTPLIVQPSSSSLEVGGGIYYKKIGVDYGNSATIVVTLTGSPNNIGIAGVVFTKDGTVSTVDTINARNNSATSQSSTIDVSKNGLVVGVYGYNDTDAGTATFSVGLTDDTADEIVGEAHSFVFGFDTFAAAETGRTITGSGQASSKDSYLGVVSLL